MLKCAIAARSPTAIVSVTSALVGNGTLNIQRRGFCAIPWTGLLNDVETVNRCWLRIGALPNSVVSSKFSCTRPKVVSATSNLTKNAFSFSARFRTRKKRRVFSRLPHCAVPFSKSHSLPSVRQTGKNAAVFFAFRKQAKNVRVRLLVDETLT